MTLEQEARQAIAGPRSAVDPKRLIELHKSLVGGYPEKWYCATCKGKLNMIFTDLKLKYYTKTNNIMSKSTKYRFTKEAINNNVEIALTTGDRTEVIRHDTMTDAQAERVLKSEFKHNIEKIEQPESKTADQGAAKPTTTTKSSK